MERLRVDVEPVEYRALARLAERELRPIPDQAHHLLREALRREGVLSATPSGCTDPNDGKAA